MAGTDTRFSRQRQRVVAALLKAQEMGLTNEPDGKLTFFAEDPRTFTDVDSAGKPWDYRNPGPVTPNVEPPKGVLAIAGIEELEVTPNDTSIGKFTPIRLRLTFLPVEWAKVSDFVVVGYGGLIYTRQQTLRPEALFDLEFPRVEVRTHDSK